MHTSKTFTAILLAIGVLGIGCGCRMFYRSRVISGYAYSKEAIRFLAYPGTTRDDVIASLGAPLIDSPSDGVLVYSWAIRRRVLMPKPSLDDELHPVIGSEMARWPSSPYGLFIAYDTNGVVIGHSVTHIRGYSLGEESVRWRNQFQARRSDASGSASSSGHAEPGAGPNDEERDDR